MKILKKAAAAVAAVSLAISLTACGTDVSWAARIGKDTTVPIGMYIYTQAATYRSLAQNQTINISTELGKQTVTVSDSDKAVTEYIDELAVKNVKTYVGACITAKEMELELTDDEIAEAENYAKEQYETDKEVYEKNGVAQSSIVEYFKNQTLQIKLFNAIYGKEGTKAVSDKELKQYIKDNYATVSYIIQYYYNSDSSPMTDAQKAKVKKQLEKIKKQAESGKLKFVDKCKEYSKDSSTYIKGIEKTSMYCDPSNENGKKIIELNVGELTFIENDDSIILLQRQKTDYDDAGLKSDRDSILEGYKYEDFIKELIAKAENDKSVSFNQAAFDKFGSSTRDFSNLSIPSNYSYY